jgi:predicted small lipoprotein YifL
MQRALRVLALLIFVGAITGCGEDSSTNSAPPSPVAAKETAAKMPPPPAIPK